MLYLVLEFIIVFLLRNRICCYAIFCIKIKKPGKSDHLKGGQLFLYCFDSRLQWTFINVHMNKVTRFDNFTVSKVLTVVSIKFLDFHLIVEIKVFTLRLKRQRYTADRQCHVAYVCMYLALARPIRINFHEKYILNNISACVTLTVRKVSRRVARRLDANPIFYENRCADEFAIYITF